MPLLHGVVSLQSASAVQSKPKHAMMVRMSAETLDALDAFPHCPLLSVDLGDVPGIYIGDALFPMRAQKESTPHELYLRVASAAKPNAPLKLYAHVIGKFIVERQLGEKITDRVRQQTWVAKQQHLERQAILLDQPPPLPAKSHKRKTPGSTTAAKKSSPLAAPPRKISPLPPTPSKANADLRRRLVHFLAISPRLADDAVKMVGGASISTSAREDLLALLDDVAEQQPPPKKADKSPRPWTLKPQSWTLVRPFEWPKLSEAARVTMARQARMAFKALGIPESDPAWDNVRYRPTPSTVLPTPPPAATTAPATSTSTRPSTTAQADAKRPAITTKDTKLKSKQDMSRVKGEIQMKDESTKPSASRPSTIKREPPSDSATAVKTVTSRRLPGSGYQVKKSPQPSTVATGRSATPVPSLPASLPQKPPPAAPAGGSYARKTISTMPSKPVKKEDESDREQEADRQRERERREREKERQREGVRVELEKREKVKQKEREAEKRQREREELEPDKRQRDRERIAKEGAAGGAVSVFKRKAAAQGAEEADGVSSKVSKRRRLDDSTFAPPPKARDPGWSDKPTSPVPRLKMKKDFATTSASGSTHKPERPSKSNGSSKQRRRSPIYTSSEDEGEIPQPRKRNPSPPPTSDRSNSSDQPPSERRRTARTTYPPATDHAALRAMYQSQYTTYLGTFSKVVAQKRKIEAMLNGDSEAEVDVMDPEDLIKLSMEHKTLKSELEHIQDIYARGVLD